MPTPLNINNQPQTDVNNVPGLHDARSPQVGQLRSTFSPAPQLGLPPRWNVGDLPQSYSTPVALITASVANVVSAAFDPQANSVELYATFSDDITSCTLEIYTTNAAGAFVPIAVYNNVSSLNCSNLYAGEFIQNVSLGGRPVQVAISNYTGAGTITISCNRLN